MSRSNEWYAVRRGPKKLQMFINLTFWPYTLQCASYPITGSMLAPTIHWDRVGAIFLIYLLGLGIAAHALDARASNKPWGKYLSDRTLLLMAIVAIVAVVAIGGYYALQVPLLWVFGILEIFFVFAYNMELFHGLFHSDRWFAVSWGFLPVLAGFVIQSNTLNILVIAAGFFGFFTAYIEINASRPYREMRKLDLSNIQSTIHLEWLKSRINEDTKRYELILKSVVATVILVAVTLVLMRVL